METIKVTPLILLCLILLPGYAVGASPASSPQEIFTPASGTYYSPPTAPTSAPSSAPEKKKAIQRPEYQVKAGLLKRFLFFCTWPPNQPIPDSEATFNIGFVKKDEVYEFFESSADDKLIKNKKVKTLYIESGKYEDLKQCHVLFIPKLSKSEFSSVIESIGKLPILTVSDYDEYRENGIIISLYIAQDKKNIVFDINHSRAKKCNLVLSSRMLMHAKNVK